MRVCHVKTMISLGVCKEECQWCAIVSYGKVSHLHCFDKQYTFVGDIWITQGWIDLCHLEISGWDTLALLCG